MAVTSNNKKGLAKHYSYSGSGLATPQAKKGEKNEGYPKDNIDPDRKDKAWILQYAKSMYADWFRSSANYVVSSGQKARFIKYIKYAQGNQDIDLYKNLLDVDKKTDYLNIDWSVVALIPKYLDIIKGIMQKMRYDITCDTLDPTSIDNKRQRDFEMKSQISIREELEQLDKLAGMDMRTKQEKELPQSMEELEVLLEGSDYKEATEIGMEEGLKWVFEKNDWNEIANKIRFYLPTCGIAATKDDVDADGNITIRFCDPIYLITSYSNREDFKKIRHAGEIRFMTIEEIKEKAGDDIPAEDYGAIIRLYAGNYGNGPYNSNIDFGPDYEDGYDDYRVPVMEFEFISGDTHVYEEKQSAYGSSSIYRRPYDYVPFEDSKYERKTHVKKVNKIYKGMWIIGTNYMFDYGPAQHQKRGDSLSEVDLSYHIMAPGLEKMNNKSLVERMIPFANEIAVAWYKLQNAIALARPKGLSIEITGLMEANMPGKGGKVLEPLELIEIYNKTGNLLWSKGDNSDFNYKPVEEIENGLGKEVGQYMELINNNIELMRQVSGLNAISDASTPHPDQLIGTAKMANAATSNAMNPLIEAYERLYVDTARGVAKRIQNIVRGNGDGKKDLKEVIGSDKVRFLNITSDLSMIDMGITLAVTLNDEQEANLNSDINAGLAQRVENGGGGITFEDAQVVRRIKNLKLAAKMLTIRRKQRLKEDEEKAAAASQANAEAQAQAAQQASQLEQQRMEMEEGFKDTELQREMDLLTHEYGLKMDLEDLRGSTKILQTEQKGEIDESIQSQKNMAESMNVKVKTETAKPKAA